MRVCHFCETSVEGVYFRNTAEGLMKKGVQVLMVELGGYNPPNWLKELPGVEYFSLGVTSRTLYPLAIWRLARLLKNKKVDIVHAHLYYAGFIAVMTKWLRVPTIVALMRHHTSVVRMLGTGLHVRLDRWMAENADHAVTVSDAARSYMRDVDGIKAQIDVVHLGFNFKTFAKDGESRTRVRSEFGFSEEDHVIGYIGNFVVGKGHIQLLRSFARILEQIPNAKLFIVGRGMLAEVETAAFQFPEGSIVFSGWRSDSAACLNAMDVFVQPSLSEAFSQVLIEAMGVGLPVVATDVGGAREVIKDGVNGFLIPPGDIQAIAESVVRLHSDVKFAGNMALEGQKGVRESFTVEKMVDKQAELYEFWLAEKKGGKRRKI